MSFNHVGLQNKETGKYEVNIKTQKDYTEGIFRRNFNYKWEYRGWSGTQSNQTVFVECKPNTTYTIKRLTNDLGIRIDLCNSNKVGYKTVMNSSSAQISTFTTEETGYVLFFFYNQADFNKVNFILQEGNDVFIDLREDEVSIEIDHPLKGLPSGVCDEIFSFNNQILLVTRVGEKPFNQQYTYTQYNGTNGTEISDERLNAECHALINELRVIDDESIEEDDYKQIGTLYTDGEGNPILSENGLKQYKIKILNVEENGNVIGSYDLIIPQQLNKSGGISDRIYWSDLDKCYKFEKNIEELYPAATYKAVVGKFRLGEEW